MITEFQHLKMKDGLDTWRKRVAERLNELRNNFFFKKVFVKQSRLHWVCLSVIIGNLDYRVQLQVPEGNSKNNSATSSRRM